MNSRAQKILSLARSQQISSSSEEFSEDCDDSIADKNYFPSDDESNSNESEMEVVESENEIVDVSKSDEWKEEMSIENIFTVTCPDKDVFNIPPNTNTPVQLFQLFITDDLIEIMVNETNRYAMQQKENITKQNARILKWDTVNMVEMKKFFAIIIAMGIVEEPKLNFYWSKDSLFHNEFISKIMSRDRFLIILKCWHFVNNLEDVGEDKLFKLRPVLDNVIRNFQQYIIPGKNTIIDESMVHWRGRLGFRQYIKNKRHKYGIKLYKLCCVSGYILNFKVYTGKTDVNSGVGHAEAVINVLMRPYYNNGRTLFCDNFYTTVNVAENLAKQNTQICGTFRQNRRCYPNILRSKKLKKGEVYGLQKKNVKVIKWMDKRPVSILTTCSNHCATLVETGKIDRNQIQIKKPQCILDYNAAKKGVDYR